MYRSCIFCSADLGANESIEAFPVGRSLAFDGEKGRLWAVCPRCARWNLAPIEERWEPIEEAERLFRDTRLRAQRENIGLARLADGTRLIRVGDALPGELAVWRYGETLVRRRRRFLLLTGALVTTGLGVGAAGVLGAGLSLGGAAMLWEGGAHLVAKIRSARPVARVSAADTEDGEPAVIRHQSIRGAELGTGDDGALRLRLSGGRSVEVPFRPGILRVEARDLVLHGPAVHRVLMRAMARVNADGAHAEGVRLAVTTLAAAGSPREYVRRMANEGYWLGSAQHSWPQHLALEMALHEETERRALEGELSALEEMWKQAEEIASIADRLPDDVPASTPPRLA